MNAPYVQSSPVANVTPVFKRFVPCVVARHLTRHFHLHTPSIDGEGTSSSAKCVVVRGCHLLSHGHIQWTFLAIVCVCVSDAVCTPVYTYCQPIVYVYAISTASRIYSTSSENRRKDHKTQKPLTISTAFQIAKIQLHPSLKWFNFKGKFHQCG